MASAGNTFKINTSVPALGLKPRFERYYMCFDGTKKALTKTCRPLIGLDGCHLKHKYGGILPIVVERDPNDLYLSSAFAVIETFDQKIHGVGLLNFFLKTLEIASGVLYLTNKR